MRAIVLFVAAAAGVFVVGACGADRNPVEAKKPADAVKIISVADLFVRVPSEWRTESEETSFGSGTFMTDPRHKPSGAVTSSVSYGGVGSDLSVQQFGALVASALRSDGRFTAIRGQAVDLPFVKAYQVRFDARLGNSDVTGLKYALVHAGNGYVVTYEAISSQAASHMPQFQSSARSLRFTQGAYACPPALVATKRISKGERGSAILHKLLYQVALLPCSDRREGAIVDPGYLEGRFVTREILYGEQLIRSDFSNPGAKKGSVPNPVGCGKKPLGTNMATVVAVEVIRKGTLGSAVLAKKLARTVPVACVWRIQDAIVSPAYLKGRVAMRDIFPGQQLTRSQFS